MWPFHHVSGFCTVLNKSWVSSPPYPGPQLTCTISLDFSLGNGLAFSWRPRGSCPPCFYSCCSSPTISPPLYIWRAISFSRWIPICYLVSPPPLLPCLPTSSQLVTMKSSQMSSYFHPRFLHYSLKTAHKGSLVRHKSDHASALYKTLWWHPFSLGANASLVTSTNVASLSLSLTAPLFTPSAPATLLLTHWLPQGRCSGCFLCLEFSLPNDSTFAPLGPSGTYLLKSHFLSKPFPGTLSKMNPLPPIPSPLHFSPYHLLPLNSLYIWLSYIVYYLTPSAL